MQDVDTLARNSVVDGDRISGGLGGGNAAVESTRPGGPAPDAGPGSRCCAAADTSLWVAQAGLTYAIAAIKDGFLTGGAGYFDYGNTQGEEALGASATNFRGNTSVGGGYESDFDIVQAFGEVGLSLAGRPFSVFGELLVNTAAESEEDTGYLVGAGLGKCRDPKTWQVTYNYRDLEADAALAALTAEKAALVAGKEQLQTADATNLENIEQIEKRMGQAAGYFDADEVKSLYATFLKAFAEWKGQSRNVVSLAGSPDTSSSLEEMSSMTQRNAGNAAQANTLATEARSAAGAGTESMNRMNDAIRAIQKSSDETAKILKAIDEIAFQANLLALNAAVEAARAGEAGKGFAVVAEEVRNLAMRSAEAAKNTAGMIEESVRNSKNGVDIAAEVAKVLEEIVQSVGKTTDLVGEIAAASQEQARGIEQVNTAVSQMDKVTQQNAANAEESASASEELTAQARSLDGIVGELVSLVGGAASKANSAPANPMKCFTGSPLVRASGRRPPREPPI